MYERSAIVLERYIETILEFNKKYNLKENYKNYKELIDEIEDYQIITTKEGKIIQEFDDTVKEIENIQKEQEKLYKANLKLEESRNNLFSDLGEDAYVLESKFQKIETNLDKNNEQLKNLKNDFVKYLSDFAQRQKERNKCEKARRLGEANHIEYIKKAIDDFKSIDAKDVTKLKQFISSEEEQVQEITEIMTKNGKNEKVAFDKEVLNLAAKTRIDIAKREAECYITIYDKMKRLLAEVENDNLNLSKYKKALRDASAKLALLNAKKDYLISFLDYERMTTISGAKTHKKMMEEACKNFELDIEQINNLYELILREIANKSTKKAYKELYNKTYLKNIEDKEKNFEKEVNNIKINMGTVINSNYWRIEGIKNAYNVFQNEVSEKFEKELIDLKIEEIEVKSEMLDDEKNVNKGKTVESISDDEEENEFYDNKDDEEDEENNSYDGEIDEDDEEFYYDDDEDEFSEEEDEDDFYDDEDDEDDELEEDYDEDDEDEFYDEENDEEDEFYDEENDEYDELEEDYDENDDEDEFYDEEDEEYDDDDFFDDEDDEYDDFLDDEDDLEYEDNETREIESKNKDNKKNAKKVAKVKNVRKNNKEEQKVESRQESRENNGILGKIFKDKKASKKK